MQLLAVVHEEHEVRAQRLAHEGDVAVGPLLGRDAEQPGIEARGGGQVGHPDARVELLRIGPIGDVAQHGEHLEAGADLVAGDTEVVQALLVGEALVLAIGVL